MNKEDIIKLAREAGLFTHKEVQPELLRFANLVAAAERDKYEVQFKKLMQLHEVRESQPNKPCCIAEREECARACERGMVKGGEVFAARIRARGNT
jgi:hypothetical protein